MKLSTRVLSGLLTVSIIFAVLLLLLIFQYSSSVAMVSTYVEETQPARVAIEHLLATIYDDFLLVEEYLLISNYSALAPFDEKLVHSQEQCEILTEQVDDLILLEKITNEKAIMNYRTALLVYSSWERSRDTLLSMHKEALATELVSSDDIAKEKKRFVALMQNSTSFFAESLGELNYQHIEMQKSLREKTIIVESLLIALMIIFLMVSVIGSYMIIQRVTRPVDEMIETSINFTKGDYTSRVDESSSISEIISLQRQLNRVYSLIDSTFKTQNQKNKASDHLLPSQYKDILDFIHDAAEQGRTPTIKDVKKHFSLTHPTVVSRLRYLKKYGYIDIRKQGRTKCIYEL